MRTVDTKISYAFSQIRVNFLFGKENYVMLSQTIRPREPEGNPEKLRNLIEKLKEEGILFDFP